ncbi:MAG: hypothetical protein U0I51_04095 [Muricomes sp.]|uniref:hypothetical protein n=1 Tax=Faecalicatena contorta TaxID=39482 RepID=UPI002EC26AF2|nr:hypothetical protein [Muricomes sp.]
MKEKLIRFMQGRYGVDTLSKFLLIVGLAVVLISSVIGGDRVRLILYALGWVLIIYCYFRMFSKNVTKRYAENQTFLAKTSKIRGFFWNQKAIWKQRKTHHIYKCPGCGQKIRVPKGKGKIEVRCPKCSKTFIKNS